MLTIYQSIKVWFQNNRKEKAVAKKEAEVKQNPFFEPLALLRKPVSFLPKHTTPPVQFYMSHPDHRDKVQKAFEDAWEDAPDNAQEIAVRARVAARMLAEEPVSVRIALDEENQVEFGKEKEAYFEAVLGQPSDKPEDILE
jgi:hypothetical protein